MKVFYKLCAPKMSANPGAVYGMASLGLAAADLTHTASSATH